MAFDVAKAIEADQDGEVARPVGSVGDREYEGGSEQEGQGRGDDRSPSGGGGAEHGRAPDGASEGEDDPGLVGELEHGVEPREEEEGVAEEEEFGAVEEEDAKGGERGHRGGGVAAATEDESGGGEDPEADGVEHKRDPGAGGAGAEGREQAVACVEGSGGALEGGEGKPDEERQQRQ